jgi:hypothetical protein
MATKTDQRTLSDLAKFARLELAAHDIEPWADVLRYLTGRAYGSEQAAWLVKLYNATDDLASAYSLYSIWPGPASWEASGEGGTGAAALVKCGTERRNLRGGKIRQHLNSYIAALDGQPQLRWLVEAFPGGFDSGAAFDALMSYMRRSVWGTGRLAAFEWAEFSGKVLRLPVLAAHGCLWESSGPRESLERIYNGGAPAPSQQWLDDRAWDCLVYLADNGAPLDWWDLETVICDFNVMRKGRYYPGKHLAMIREEIDQTAEPHRTDLLYAFNKIVPEPWRQIMPGASKELGQHYARSGKILDPFGRVS